MDSPRSRHATQAARPQADRDGGKAAETIWYGEEQTSTGASSDLRAATYFATGLVGRAGLGSSLVSMDVLQPSMNGDESMKLMLQPGPIRQEIDAILRGCLAETEELLRQKAHCVEVLRDYLLVPGTRLVLGGAVRLKFEVIS